MHYLDKKEAKVKIAEELMNRGWQVYGYHPDESDSMTDYFHPASWDGVATKNGYVLVIDNSNTYYSGYVRKNYIYNSKRASTNDRINKLTALMNDEASTENEKASCAALIQKEQEKAGQESEYTILETYPSFAHGNPKNSCWHIEKDGQIIAKGNGAFAVNSVDWNDDTKTEKEQKAEKLNAFISRIEKAISSADALQSEVIKVPKVVTKPIEKEDKIINKNDILSFTYHGHYWIVLDVYTVGEQVRVTYELLGSEKRGYKRVSNAKRYYQTLNKIQKEMEECKVKVYTLQEVTEYVEKTVFKKTARKQKIVDAPAIVSSVEITNTETNDNLTENVSRDDQATSKQLWALRCATKLNTKDLKISKQKASELIANSKKGQNITSIIKSLLQGSEIEKDINEKAMEVKQNKNTSQESDNKYNQAQCIPKIEKQIESAQKKLNSLSGDYLTNTWKRQQEENSREMKRNSLRFEISLLEYLKDRAISNSMTKLEQALLVGSFRDQIHYYSIQKAEISYPQIDNRYDLEGWYNSDVPKKQKRLAKAEIFNTNQLKNAVDEYKQIKDIINRPIDSKKQKIKKLESDVKFRKIDGYYPTPKTIVEKMLDLADIRDSEIVLEPSAGNGNILDGITEYLLNYNITAELQAIEYNHSLREILELKGYKLVENDFLEYKSYNQFDKIVMNPPFEKTKDIEHVEHAYKHLKEGGRLVAIMSPHFTFARDTNSISFREWLNDKGYYEMLPDGSFKESGTNVNTVLVVIDKVA